MNDTLLHDAYALHQAGKFAEAAALYEEILHADPAHGDALYLLGFTHLQRGSFQDALAYCERALAIRPKFADAHLARGAALSNLGHHTEALSAYDDALAQKPDNPTAWNHRGNALLEMSRDSEALQSYERALAIKPAFADAWRHRALALSRLGRIEDALTCLDRVSALAPNEAGLWEERANLLTALGRRAEAIAAFDRAIAQAPDNPHLLYNRANALAILKQYQETIEDCTRLLEIAPDYPYARGVLMQCKLQSCDWKGLDEDKTAIAAAIAAGKRTISPFNHKALSDSPAEQLNCAQIWTAHECPPSAPLWRGERYTHERIRVAYVSADLNNSAVATLMAGIFEHHDRARFETVAISFGPENITPMRTRLEAAFDRFLNVRAKSEAEIAAILRAMETDIAVDLTGFTGECRPRIFAARPAPVQVNYLGFPGTMGAAYMDYILADAITIPADQAQFYAEKVVHLPGTYLPADAKRPVSGRTMNRAGFGLPEPGFVFCSFNNAYKLSPHLFDIWMRLLTEVPGSVLWLPESHPLAMQNLRREATERGVDPRRIVFAAPIPAPDEHLARLKIADLFLDTLPYNAHTTASDALWAGLPLLTCMGQGFAGRVAASLLATMGLPELITHSLADYEAQALRLARDSEALAAIRAKLARNRDTTPLFDTARFTRNLESAFTTMWQRAQRGEPPAGFTIGAAS